MHAEGEVTRFSRGRSNTQMFAPSPFFGGGVAQGVRGKVCQLNPRIAQKGAAWGHRMSASHSHSSCWCITASGSLACGAAALSRPAGWLAGHEGGHLLSVAQSGMLPARSGILLLGEHLQRAASGRGFTHKQGARRLCKLEGCRCCCLPCPPHPRCAGAKLTALPVPCATCAAAPPSPRLLCTWPGRLSGAPRTPQSLLPRCTLAGRESHVCQVSGCRQAPGSKTSGQDAIDCA